MRPDLTLIDSIRRVIDFAGLSGNLSCQLMLISMLEDIAKAVAQEKSLLPANLTVAPSYKSDFRLQAESTFSNSHSTISKPVAR